MTEGLRKEGRLLIGDLVLDVGRRSVSRDGRQIDLPKLSFRLLQVLAEAAPNVLSQDDLAERVWPGRVISPDTLTQRVKLLRQAIGDDARDPRYIGLVRGEGYRLLAEIQVLPDEGERPARLFLAEILRRNVLPVAAIYAVVSWAMIRGLSALDGAMPAVPDWLPNLMSILLTAGFPAAMWFMWRRGEWVTVGRPWANSSEGRLVAAAALLALAAGTAGLSALIFPSEEMPANDVAVMPFRNTGNDPSDDYLGAGIAGQLRDQLGDVAGLRVVARASSASVAFEDLEPAAVAQLLDAKLLVSGTIERLGKLLNISVELIDAGSGGRLWSDSYLTDIDGLLAIQQQIFDDVAGRLSPGLRSETAGTSLPTTSESAYSLLLVANKYYHDVLDQPVIDRNLLRAAIDAYQRAAAEDPGSPLLHSRLAAALLYDGKLIEAEESIRRAIALDSQGRSSHVQHTLGLYMQARHENGVGDHYARAIELNPNNVNALSDYGLYLYARSNISGARQHLERALAVDPRSLVRYEQLGNFYGTNGFYDEAIALARRIELNFDDAEAFLTIARIHEVTGELDEAIAWAERARRHDPTFKVADWKLAELYAQLGDADTAMRYDPAPSVSRLYFSREYEELIDVIVEQGAFDGYSSDMIFALATAYAATDRPEPVVSLLTRYGLPEFLQTDSVTTSELEAGITLADALRQIGRDDDARRLAEPLLIAFRKYADEGPNAWHPYINLACLLSISGDQFRAMEMLEQMMKQRGLPWYPRVRDQPCFRLALADDPRYQAVLDSIRERQRQLLDRLPSTLERFGLSDEVFR